MTTFDDREKSFEKKFEHDQELQFKVNARKNKLLGLWAAGLMGKTGADAEAYAKDIVMAEFEKPGDHDVDPQADARSRRGRQADGGPHHPQAGRTVAARGQAAGDDGDALDRARPAGVSRTRA